MVGLVLLLAGFLTGRAPVGDLRGQVALQETRVAEMTARAQANEALALLYRTVLDLDERNFGTANERLDAAAGVLGRIDPVALGVDPARLDPLRQSVAATDLRVAEDLDQQRTQVLGFARELNQMTETTALN